MYLFKVLKNPLYVSIFIVVIITASIFSKSNLSAFLESHYFSEQRARWIGDMIINFTLFFFLYQIIKKMSLQKLGGINGLKIQNKSLLLIPFIILIPMSSELLEIDWFAINLMDLSLLFFWALSIGLFEEAALRGLLQSSYIKKYWKARSGVLFSVFVTSFIFGVLHFISWSGNLYSEISQVLVAIILGILFGALLLKTNKLYPIAIIHALFDFFSGIDELKNSNDIINVNSETYSVLQEFSVVFILLPFLIIGIILLIKIKSTEIESKLAI